MYTLRSYITLISYTLSKYKVFIIFKANKNIIYLFALSIGTRTSTVNRLIDTYIYIICVS